MSDPASEASVRADQTRQIVEWLHVRACRCYGKDQDHAGAWWSNIADAIHRKFGGPRSALPKADRGVLNDVLSFGRQRIATAPQPQDGEQEEWLNGYEAAFKHIASEFGEAKR
jgi:hypothetical protein